MILLLITILLIAVVIYNQFIKCDKEIDSHEKKKIKNNNKKLSVIRETFGDNTINKKDLNKYNKIYRKNICLDKKKNIYKKKIEIVENEINSLDNLLNKNNDMKSLNNIDNNTLSDIETFVK